jgi:uncharacterized membrane protein YbhN (UPF0104 family)
MSHRWCRWAQLGGGAVILGFLVIEVGAAPFLRALPLVTGWPVALAAAITALTTACCAWRWSLVAKGLGVDVPFRTALAAYYGSQFLNATLPGGVLGDVHRGLRHGRAVGDVGRGLRAVAWERCAGQVVQLGLALVVLLLLPSPVRSFFPVLTVAVVAGALGVLLLSRPRLDQRSSLWATVLRTTANDLRHGVLSRQAWPGIVVASCLAVVGHALVFLLAARLGGTDESPMTLLPIAFLVLLAMAVPTNIAGWGPREGVAAWAFHAAGMSAAQGVTTSVVYGVLVIITSLPGLAVLAARGLRPATSEHEDLLREGRPRSSPMRESVAGG